MAATHLVVFSHGMLSRPDGTKILELSAIAREEGFEVLSVDYTSTVQPDERVEMLLDLGPTASQELILVGSSMGSYVSIAASKALAPTGLFLLAPALYLPGYIDQAPTPHAESVSVVHGWGDEVISYEHSVRFCHEHKATLHLLDADHRLLGALEPIKRWFRQFLRDRLATGEGAS